MTRAFPRTLRFALAYALLFACAAPAAAQSPSSASIATPLFGSYWDEFVDHWLGQLKQQNGVVLFALGIGAVSLFIITRGKWRK